MPTEALVLVRVHNVGENPEISFLVEPWKQYIEEKLVFNCKGPVKGRPIAQS